MVTAENRSYVNRVNKEEDYIAYYNGIYKFLGGVSMKSGISGIRLAMCFNRLSRRALKKPLVSAISQFAGISLYLYIGFL